MAAGESAEPAAAAEDAAGAIAAALDAAAAQEDAELMEQELLVGPALHCNRVYMCEAQQLPEMLEPG